MLKELEIARNVLSNQDTVHLYGYDHPVKNIAQIKKNILRSVSRIGNNKSGALKKDDPFLNCHWFDFRNACLQDTSGYNILYDYAKKLEENNSLNLPFEECVFAFLMKTNPGNSDIYSYIRLKQNVDDSNFQIVEVTTCINGIYTPLSLKTESMTKHFNEVIYILLGLLNSSSCHMVYRRKGKPNNIGENERNYHKNTSYSIVKLVTGQGNCQDFYSGQLGADAITGNRSRPRRHWRRGHIRRVGGETLYISPTLVNSDIEASVEKDYVH